MKKQFLFGMVAVAALCSCSNNEVMEAPESLQTPVTFGTYVGNSVNGRAAVIDLNGLKYGANTDGNAVIPGFGVFAYYTGQDAWSAVSSKSPNFMYNDEVTYTTSWEYSLTKYWPNNTDDKISFFAYAPYKGSATNVELTAANTMTEPKIKFTVNHNVSKQEDLLWAATTNQSKRPLASGSTAENTPGYNTTDRVMLTFGHALSRIGFKAEIDVNAAAGTSTNEIAAGTTITIEKVELLGSFHASGTVNLEDGTIEGTGVQADLSTPSGASLPPEEATITGAGFELNSPSHLRNNTFTGTTTTCDALNKTDSYIMVIPQAFSGDGNKLRIRVTYKVETADTSLPNGTSSVVTNVVISDPFEYTFAQGKAYTFNLRIGMTSVKVDASETSWRTKPETNDNQDVPANR